MTEEKKKTNQYDVTYFKVYKHVCYTSVVYDAQNRYISAGPTCGPDHQCT